MEILEEVQNFGVFFTDVGRDSAIGIATCYELDGPQIEFGGGEIFRPPSRLPLGSTQPLIQQVPDLSRG